MIHFLEKYFSTLRKKIALALIVVSLIAGGAFMYFAHKTGYTMLEKDSQAKAHSIARFGKALFEYLMTHDRREQLEFALKKIVVPDQVSDLLILKSDGTISLHTSSSSQVKLPLDEFTTSIEYPDERFLFRKEGDLPYEYVITPIVKKADCYSCHNETDSVQGYLAVKTSMNDVRSVALQHRTTNIVMTIMILAGWGFVLFIALLFLIIRPISKFREQITHTENALEQFEKGESIRFNELSIPNKYDEIAGLVIAFNKLIHRLNEAHEKLNAMHLTQLEHADRLASAGEMAAGIAHEIKNPIAGVLGALQVFDAETKKDDDRKEIIAEMIIQLERVNHAVNDLLSYARPAPPVFDFLNIGELIKKTISLLSQQIKRKQIEITTDFGERELTIIGDRKQLQQVLWNITLNAVQSIEEKGLVTIGMVNDNSTVKIIIKDTGKGISPEQLTCVFQPFFTTKHKGTGLGMTISRRIIEQHHGSISIESKPGKGTIISITLPKGQDRK